MANQDSSTNMKSRLHQKISRPTPPDSPSATDSFALIERTGSSGRGR
jgi:hypothetical protein